MADQVRKIVSVHIGNEIDDPKLGIKGVFIGGSETAKAHLMTLPHFNVDGAYAYMEIKSKNPEALKPAVEEFLNTSMATAKEMSPDISAVLGEGTFEVSIADQYVVAAINLKMSEKMKQAIARLEHLSDIKLEHERSFTIGLTANKSIRQLLDAPKEELADLQGLFALDFVSSKSDKYLLKQLILEMAAKQEAKKLKLLGIEKPEDKPEEKVAKLLILMFHTAQFQFRMDNKEAFGTAVNSSLDSGREMGNGIVEQLHQMYEGNKETLASFPFVQAFFDAVEEQGTGELRLGLFHKVLAGELDIYCHDLGYLYKKVVK